MKNGKFIAIFVGFIIGLLLTLGIYSAQRAYNIALGPTPTPTVTTQTLEETEAPAKEFSLFLPVDFSISTTRSVEFSGTAPGAYLVIGLSDDEEVFTTPNASGDFVLEMNMQPGLNVITLISLDSDTNQQSKLERSIYYQAAPTSAETED